MNLTKMLERARRLGKDTPCTWYRLAKELGVSHARLWRWRNGSIPDNNGALALARVLHMPLADVVRYLEEDRALKHKDKKTAAAWTAQLPRLLPSVAIASASVMALAGALTDGTTTAAARIAALPAIHYAHYRSEGPRRGFSVTRRATHAIQLAAPHSSVRLPWNERASFISAFSWAAWRLIAATSRSLRCV